MKIVTFYTDKYKDLVFRMIDSASKQGYEVEEEHIKDTGSWKLNTDQKALIVLKHLLEGEEFLITDADSEIVASIDFTIFEDCDFSARIKGGVELLSGTMYFNPTPEVFGMVGKWIELNGCDDKRVEQVHLKQALSDSKVRFKELSDRYCVIFDETPKIENPIIIHYQASRKFRKELNASRA